MTNTAHIHYTEPNQEPSEHIKAKERIRHILYNFDYTTVTNSNDGHHEYTLPELVTPFIAKTEEERIRKYQIDLLMHSVHAQQIIAIEINGDYHYSSRENIRKMRLKYETINEYLASHDHIEVKNVKHLKKYYYNKFKVIGFPTEDIYGPYSYDRLEIINKILN